MLLSTEWGERDFKRLSSMKFNFLNEGYGIYEVLLFTSVRLVTETDFGG